jgi:hypothetical protein
MATTKQRSQPQLENLAGFDELSNVFGPLKPAIRKRLLAVLTNPTEKTWDNAYSICVQPFLTLWQAWIAIDATAPRVGPREDFAGKRIEGWSRIPTSDEIFSALRYATTKPSKTQYSR